MPKATHLAPTLVALLLGCSALSSAQAGWFSSDSKPAAAAQTDDKTQAIQPSTTLDDSILQAQKLRLAGNYKEALNHLSQLMLVAADDGRVISEYGKTLVSMGRAEEAQKFLTRAQQLTPNDWTVYSAMGVVYDELGNQAEAKINYEHALALKPGEPSVLSNYALSRMLAKDPAGARKLADRAEVANAVAPDVKITRDIAMIRSMAPQTDAFAVNTPAPTPAPMSAPIAAPHAAVAAMALPPPAAAHAQPMPQITRPAPAAMAASAAPQPLAAHATIQAQPQVTQMLNPAPRVVMEPVPVDPLAGPVGPRTATRAPRSLQPRAQVSNEAPIRPEARPAVEAASSPAKSLEIRAEAIASTLNKPGAIAEAKAEATKGLPARPATRPASKVSVPVKAADVKPGATLAAPKVLPPAGIKEASAKPANKPAKAAAKDEIPGLRLSANAY